MKNKYVLWSNDTDEIQAIFDDLREYDDYAEMDDEKLGILQHLQTTVIWTTSAIP